MIETLACVGVRRGVLRRTGVDDVLDRGRRVAGAVAERRREFATVRYCARKALRQIGVPAVPILPDVDRAPRWPVGVVGSMTHCAGYRAAAVARSGELCGLGIDAEPARPGP